MPVLHGGAGAASEIRQASECRYDPGFEFPDRGHHHADADQAGERRRRGDGDTAIAPTDERITAIRVSKIF